MQFNETPSPAGQLLRAPEWVAVIGAGTGGPQALAQLLPQFPADLPGSVIVIQQMRPGFTRVLVDILQPLCRLPVFEPDDGQALLRSRILIAPSDTTLRLVNEGSSSSPEYRVILEDLEKSENSVYSRIDTAMTSCATVFGNRSRGVLLTSLGADGREGMRAIRDAGGITIAQDQASSVVHTLPASAIEAGVVHEVLPLWSIAESIVSIREGNNNAVAA